MDGEFNRARWRGGQALLNQRVCKVRPATGSIDDSYLFYALPKILKSIEDKAPFVTVKHLSVNDLRVAELLLPPVGEQRRIAAILDKADGIQRKCTEARALAECFLRSAYVYTVGHLNPHYTRWTPHTVEQLADSRKGAIRSGPFGSALRHGEFVEEGIAVLGIDNAVQNKFAWDERRFITEEKYKNLRRYRVFPHDVIITIMGTTGRSAVVPEDIPEAITTKHLAAITCNTKLILPEVLSFAIHSDPTVIQQIEMHNKGAIMDGLNLGIIRKLVVNLPPMQEQNRFAEILTRMRAVEERFSQPTANGTDLFNSLSQHAFP